ncbi:MAG: GNAT family N-acetyltransferase [Solirubrobacteraceae bacterium]
MSVTDMLDPGILGDGVLELRRWQDDDVAAVRATRGDTEDAAMAWIRRQQSRPLSVGISCAIAPIGHPAAGYVGLIRRPRLEMGVAQGLGDGKLVFSAHRQVAGIGYWIAPDAQGNGLATRAVVLLSRWALQSAGMIRVEALLDPNNIASRRVVEKSGFRREGHLRSYLELDGRPADALVFSLLHSDL